jgi:hypothetical protein
MSTYQLINIVSLFLNQFYIFFLLGTTLPIMDPILWAKFSKHVPGSGPGKLNEK